MRILASFVCLVVFPAVLCVAHPVPKVPDRGPVIRMSTVDTQSADELRLRINWEAVSTNADGSLVTQLVGYRVMVSEDVGAIHVDEPRTARDMGASKGEWVSLPDGTSRYEHDVLGADSDEVIITLDRAPLIGKTLYVVVYAYKSAATDPPYLMSAPSEMVSGEVTALEPEGPPSPPDSPSACEYRVEGFVAVVPVGHQSAMTFGPCEEVP